MQRIFNDNGFLQKIQSGEYTPVYLKDGHPSPVPAFEPFCTRSQMISYRDAAGQEIVRVHQYLRPDNTLGASGMPDPKRLLWRNTLYVVCSLRATD